MSFTKATTSQSAAPTDRPTRPNRKKDEAAPSTAKKFASRENDDPSIRPALVVEFVRPERDEEDDEDEEDDD